MRALFLVAPGLALWLQFPEPAAPLDSPLCQLVVVNVVVLVVAQSTVSSTRGPSRFGKGR